MPHSPPQHKPFRLRSTKRVYRKKQVNTSRTHDEYSRFYSLAKWKKARNFYIKQNPICVDCEAYGIIKPAKIVDHIMPIKEGGASLDPKNFQSLCHSCHNKKTARDKRKLNPIG